MKPLSFPEAVSSNLEEIALPVMSDFRLSQVIINLLSNKSYNGVRIRTRSVEIDRNQIGKRIRNLEKKNIVSPDRDFARGRSIKKMRLGVNVWKISGTPTGTAEDVACLIDPFCYVSHLSAMQRYGLSERTPKNLTISTLSRQEWSQRRNEHLQDSSQANTGGLIQLAKISLPTKLRGREIELHESKHTKKTTNIVDTFARISEIGTTFADMLDRPDLCGGMEHVINIWERDAKSHLDHIIEAIDGFPTKIIKVRAGYILNEHMKLSDPRIDKWTVFATRGGDQKLNPQGEYRPPYSEKWMLSINA